ncbi:hypothetical protein [Rhizobium sp. BK176]|uniref:hypothetical protein n=1 Tax=Rhizobium sp. BK176 TaxID=2587071 RepID=UPI0021674C43|nr:hypothetical protein [Rhizobium sp. BK176]MCS4089988.1 FMN phosphatase YigB (HAD superfamily) [Rhizobium sp. BK176]
MKTYYSWSCAVRAAIRSMDRGDVGVLSLDIFDTILLRTTDPELVIDATSHWLAQCLGLSASDVRSARNRAWSLESATAVSKGHDPETPAEAYFRTWIRLLVGERLSAEDIAEAANDTIAYEIELEKRCLIANAAILPLLKAARTRGIPVVGVSDMYLESSRIKQLLEHHDMMEFLSQVVSSADFGFQKRTGKIFGIGLADTGFYQGVEAPKVLHLGDDMTADGIMPMRTGIKSMPVYDVTAMKSRNRSFYLRRDHNAALAIANPVDPSTVTIDHDGMSSMDAAKLKMRSIRRMILKSPRVEALKNFVRAA